MNSWQFTGNLGRDCETRHTPNGDPVVSFSVGVKSGYGKNESTTWANCAMFGKRGEAVAPYLSKGQLVGVSGEVNLREWTDKDGGKRQSLDVRVNDLTLLGKKDGQANAKPEKPAKPAKGGGFDDMDSDIPFANPYRGRTSYGY
jgi:single-strand DNA-binding protein